MTFCQHARRVVGLLAIAAGLLISMAVRADLIFADGLRYIDQASRISRGAVTDGLFRSIDHPGYPLAIAAMHAVLGGEAPSAWQMAAQAAAVLAGVLLVIPLYLVTAELFGPRIAWLGCLLVYLAPIPCRVMADALSESTFLLFWTWGLWGAIRFLEQGSLRWLPLLVGSGVLAYLTRPEGMLLPAALVATLLVIPLFPATRLSWRRWGPAFGFLAIAPLCVVGPYVVAKGGVGTKPALARVLGMAAQAPADSVERARPLDPNQSLARTHWLAVKGTAAAVAEAISIPLLPLAVLGLWSGLAGPDRARLRLLLAFIVLGALLAFVRLHATNGYCTSRHALLLGLIGIPAAAAGLDWLFRRVSWPATNSTIEGPRQPRPALLAALAVVYLAWSAPALLRPLNHEGLGYRLAGVWLADRTHAPEDAKVVDGPAWSLFYGQRAGYTFENLRSALADPQARFVVVREAHLLGPWGYCQVFRDLVRGLEPIASFPTRPDKAQSRVFVFDRRQPSLPGAGVAGRETGDKRIR
jgi:4-amino-4-deoxy-L-arabinose transferase-like glycosyltransferase